MKAGENLGIMTMLKKPTAERARGGGGASRAASRRRRVRPLPWGHWATRARPARAATRLAATQTRARAGPQRRTPRRRCQARSSTGWGWRPRGASKRAEGHRTVRQSKAQPR